MRTVFFISDSTGITAETLGSALLAQFDQIEHRKISLPFVLDVNQAAEVRKTIDAAAAADGIRPVVFSTLTNADIYATIRESQALVLDLFSVFIHPLEQEFKRGSSHATGRFHGMVDLASYEVRIDAMDFALHHDDGASTRHYREADVILVGVSRSGKTPTCIYLAMQFGLRAANYPVTAEDLDGSGRLPPLLRDHRQRLYGLTIAPDRLHQVRQARRPDSRYAAMSQCRREVQEVEAMLDGHQIAHTDTTHASIEEIATRVLKDTGLKRRFS